jgi:hypothetical protein
MGTHINTLTKKADAALTDEHLLVTFGSDADHIAINAADDMPLGTVPDTPSEAEDIVAVNLLGSRNETVTMVASEAIDAGEIVYTAANGKVQDEPASGTVYKVGRALQAATADGDEIEVEPCFPVAATFGG